MTDDGGGGSGGVGCGFRLELLVEKINKDKLDRATGQFMLRVEAPSCAMLEVPLHICYGHKLVGGAAAKTAKPQPQLQDMAAATAAAATAAAATATAATAAAATPASALALQSLALAPAGTGGASASGADDTDTNGTTFELGDIVSLRFHASATAADKDAVLRILREDFERRATEDSATLTDSVRLWFAASKVKDAQEELSGVQAAGPSYRSLSSAAARVVAQPAIMSLLSEAGRQSIEKMATEMAVLQVRRK